MKYLLLLFFSVLSFGQQTTKVDFIKCDAFVNVRFLKKESGGNIVYYFNVKAPIDTIRIDAISMKFGSVKINDKFVSYNNDLKQLKLFEGFKIGKNKLSFEYISNPKQTIYFTGLDDGQQIWTQGQGKNTSHWLPSFDDVNEKVIFNLSIAHEDNLIAVGNGKFKVLEDFFGFDKKISKFQMKKPMSSYLVMLAIGKFKHKKEKSKSGIPLENYFKPVDEDKYEYTYKHSTRIFNYLEKEIGVRYPWEVYRQVPVEDFLYAGMENTSSTIFAQDFVVDESGYNDRNYINVNAHELAHQWFGDLVTAKSGKHHWLQEGFATYYALLAERDIFGDDYFFNALYRTSLQLRNAAKTDTIPVLNEKASSLSFYQKGAWALHTIREEIGAEKFQKVIKNYLKKYAYKNVETADFLNEIAKVSNFDIVKFQKKWLEDYRFPTDDANILLMKSTFYRKLVEINSYKSKSFAEKEAYFSQLMQSDIHYVLKKELLYQVVQVPFEEKKNLLLLALQTNNFEVRQAVAETFKTIPNDFKSEFESLLNDKSYDTKKLVFIKLFESFPAERAKYLEIAKDWTGKNDKDLRITFLALYQNFPLADTAMKSNYLNELISYASPNYESSIRQNALENLLQIVPKNELVLKNLVNATTHHKWQIVKYARDTIRELLKMEGYRTIFETMVPTLEEAEHFQLKRILNP